MDTPQDYLQGIYQMAREAWKAKILPSIPGGKTGAFREPRDMVPFGFDFNGINVEVHPQPTRVRGVVLLYLVGIAYHKANKEIIARDLGRVVCLPNIKYEG